MDSICVITFTPVTLDGVPRFTGIDCAPGQGRRHEVLYAPDILVTVTPLKVSPFILLTCQLIVEAPPLYEVKGAPVYLVDVSTNR